MSNWLEIGVYRGWGARRDSSDAVQELERGRLRKSPRAEAERLRWSAGPGVPWRGRSAAEQSGVGVAARVGGGASAWDGKLGFRGRFKGGRPEISGSGSGRKAAVVSAGDFGWSVARARNGEEGGAVGWGRSVRQRGSRRRASGLRWASAGRGWQVGPVRGRVKGATRGDWAGSNSQQPKTRRQLRSPMKE